MFNFQKKQKIKQPKAITTILRALLSEFKICKTIRFALYFNNLFFNQQAYILRSLKQTGGFGCLFTRSVKYYHQRYFDFQ
jgi:hypothetical protein